MLSLLFLCVIFRYTYRYRCIRHRIVLEWKWVITRWCFLLSHMKALLQNFCTVDSFALGKFLSSAPVVPLAHAHIPFSSLSRHPKCFHFCLCTCCTHAVSNETAEFTCVFLPYAQSLLLSSHLISLYFNIYFWKVDIMIVLLHRILMKMKSNQYKAYFGVIASNGYKLLF